MYICLKYTSSSSVLWGVTGGMEEEILKKLELKNARYNIDIYRTVSEALNTAHSEQTPRIRNLSCAKKMLSQ